MKEVMYYDIAIVLQLVVTPTGCIVNAMDLKIFPNTIYSAIKSGLF